MKELVYLALTALVSFAFYHAIKWITIGSEKIADKFKKKITL
jgi:hypothetical protein